MKIYIFTEKESKGKALANAKNLLMTVFPDIELKSGVGKPKRGKKSFVDEFDFVRLEDFWTTTPKMSVMRFADIIGMGVSERVLESL